MAPKNLVIVESPAKAKTIKKFLGKDFEVRSSFGHIRDLPQNRMGVDIKHDFKPEYIIPKEKKKIVSELKKAAKGKTIYLASDEDREGEAIAWHICQALGLKEESTHRIVFHEITKPAILHAIENPRKINQHLVDAQQARRILDRLVGYELSPILWKKIKAGLSAGRVQSVAVRLIVEREREIKAFKPESHYRLQAFFEKDNLPFQAEAAHRFSSLEEVTHFFESQEPTHFYVETVEQKPGKKSPPAPFTTSTLQQEAARRLGFSVKQTMVIAQQLYEAGFITYMRTDSLHLSELAITEAQKYITNTFGEAFSDPKQFKTKSASAQEAHEAIRPTDLSKPEIEGTPAQKKLYHLIWQRTIASQMAPAQIQKTIITLFPEKDREKQYPFTAQGEVVTFEGFLALYEKDQTSTDASDKHRLPLLTKGDVLPSLKVFAKETFSRHKPRYTEASLVRTLEELGIGRPSTYAPIISTIQERGYVEKKDLPPQTRTITTVLYENGAFKVIPQEEHFGAEKQKLFPTEIGKIVTDFLVKYFSEIMDYSFTAHVEKDFDIIAHGKKSWQAMISAFYKHFHALVESVLSLSKKETAVEKVLGEDPETQKEVIARIGRFGPIVQLGRGEDQEKPKFAPIPQNLSLEDITLSQALELLSYPKQIGTYEGKDIAIHIGKFGYYLKWGEKNIAIPKTATLPLSEEAAIEIIKAKEQQDAQRIIHNWPEEGIQLLRGPYGIYIRYEKEGFRKNIRIPKNISSPETLTKEACKEIVAQALKKGTTASKKLKSKSS